MYNIIDGSDILLIGSFVESSPGMFLDLGSIKYLKIACRHSSPGLQ